MAESSTPQLIAQQNRPEDLSSSSVILAEGDPAAPPARGAGATFRRNSLMNLGRLFLSTAVGFVLPSFLIHRLPATTYSAWVLILQLSAYVNYLDFGIQNGIAKYVAEYEARGDAAGSSMRASAGFALLLLVSAVGVALTVGLAWQAPHLFHDMPASLDHDVRISLLLVGVSTSFSLLCSIFASIFTGLQRFAVPTALGLVNRLLFTAVILAAVFLGKGLLVMGVLVAAVNIITGALHFVAWRKLAAHVRLSLANLDPAILKKMVAYCSALAVWTMAMLLISGLDVTIVAHYDFAQTAYYSIATAPTNFMLAIMGAALAPLLPTISAMSVHRTAAQMGDVLERTTRYSCGLLVLTGLPLLVAGYWLLRLWVGPVYATQILGYLRILVLANIVRNVCAPYANLLVATDSQKVAIAGAIAEATTNVATSVYLARHIGAIGVAYGTLIGSFVGVAMHFIVSMHYTRSKFAVSRTKLFLSGMMRPLTMAIPAVVLLSAWWRRSAPTLGVAGWAAWVISSLLLAWFVSLNPSERIHLAGALRRKLPFARATINVATPLD